MMAELTIKITEFDRVRDFVQRIKKIEKRRAWKRGRNKWQ